MTVTISRAMVLAAGLGARMRPLTDDTPKPLIRVAGRPVIDRTLDTLSSAGVTNAMVNVHYRSNMIRAHLADREVPEIAISDESEQLLDTGGAVVNALGWFGGEPFFVANTDAIWRETEPSALERMISCWDADAMDALLLMADVRRAFGHGKGGDYHMDESGRLSRATDPAHARFIYAGMYIATPAFFRDAPEAPFSTNVLWDRAQDARRLFGCALNADWFHVSTPDALGEIEAALAERPLSN